MMESNVNKLDPSWRFTRKDPTWSFLNLNHTTELSKAQQLINWADLDWGKKKIFISRHNNRDNNSTDRPSENRSHKYSRSTLITVTRSDSAPRCKSVWDLLLPPLTRREKKEAKNGSERGAVYVHGILRDKFEKCLSLRAHWPFHSDGGEHRR